MEKHIPSETCLENCLRYNSVLFMTDQDLDGSHIKGLGLNLFQSQWIIQLSTIDNFHWIYEYAYFKSKKEWTREIIL